MAAPQDKRTDDLASPKHFHHHAQRYANKYYAKFRAEMQREEAREWTDLPKEGASSGNIVPARHAKPRSVLPRSSVKKRNITKLATRSTAAQTSTTSKHSIQQTLEQSRDPSRRPTARSPTAVLCGTASAPYTKIRMPSKGAVALRWQPVAHHRRRAGRQCDCRPRRRGCHGPRRREGADLSGGGGGL